MTLNHNALNNPNKVFEFRDTEGRVLAIGERLVGICTHHPSMRETYSFMPKDRTAGACDFWCESVDILANDKYPLDK